MACAIFLVTPNTEYYLLSPILKKKCKENLYIKWRIVPPVLREGNSAVATKLYQRDKWNPYLIIDCINVINTENHIDRMEKVDGHAMYTN